MSVPEEYKTLDTSFKECTASFKQVMTSPSSVRCAEGSLLRDSSNFYAWSQHILMMARDFDYGDLLAAYLKDGRTAIIFYFGVTDPNAHAVLALLPSFTQLDEPHRGAYKFMRAGHGLALTKDIPPFFASLWFAKGSLHNRTQKDLTSFIQQLRQSILSRPIEEATSLLYLANLPPAVYARLRLHPEFDTSRTISALDKLVSLTWRETLGSAHSGTDRSLNSGSSGPIAAAAFRRPATSGGPTNNNHQSNNRCSHCQRQGHVISACRQRAWDLVQKLGGYDAVVKLSAQAKPAIALSVTSRDDNGTILDCYLDSASTHHVLQIVFASGSSRHIEVVRVIH
ncbi:hypothetical protein BZA70DRAFT_294464 [Myxozyma melibiosi]|uniref:Uncharacterized protein n=1 Tax=Myxozyma melibiosi TaxID=54550 RepID=A0ABR1FAS5_9ASCO